MNKEELTPLQALEKLKLDYICGKRENEIEYFKIIEKAHKEYEKLEKSLRKKSTREKAKMLNKYIKKLFVPKMIHKGEQR